jgi:hypothetical protein
MTASALDDYLAGLDEAAHSANVAEEVYRREAMLRIRALEQERAFAFRRLNLMRSVASAAADAKDEVDALAHGSTAFLRELGWSGASESQREVVERFAPVVREVWQASRAETAEGAGAAIERELAAFEEWFSSSRGAPFPSIMEGEVVELPLVEV